MAKRENQKGKLLLLLDFLQRETDEDHPAATAKILEMLSANGIPAERKSIYSDLDALEAQNYDIQRKPGKNGGVYLGQRPFELAELKLLVDAVQASRFITRKKSDILIKKLENLTSRHLAGQLQRQVFVGGRVKSMNEKVYYWVDTLHAAIAAKRRVSFKYFDFNSKKQQIFRRNGGLYQVEPYCLVWDNANYYLVGHEPGEDHTRHYRVDKMDSVTVTEEISQIPKDFDPAGYVNRYFSMFSGRPAKAKLWCRESLAGVILDRFGREIMIVPAENGFFVTLDVIISPQFWGWLTALGPGAKLLDPPWAAEEYKDYLKNILENG